MTPTRALGGGRLVAASLGVALALAACGGEPPPPAAPKPPPLSLVGAPLPDAEACTQRREHEKACAGISKENEPILDKVCLGERACLEEVWTKEAVDKYMLCRTRAMCGADCKLEVARTVAPSRAIQDARGMCVTACAGQDGETLCDSVLRRFTPWKLGEQAVVAACFAGTKDCFGALACAKNGGDRPMAQIGSCLAAHVVDACTTAGTVSSAPMCAEVSALLKREKQQ
ncbi:MAG: hypothetical protein IPK71_28275 [Myxococcales bacterium]|nr:hypothetical protein [Myxococcales bacterium]